MKINLAKSDEQMWPQRPQEFPDLMTPVEAAMFLRLDQTGHTPESACRMLNYWREQGELKATRFARRIWFLKKEIVAFWTLKRNSKKILAQRCYMMYSEFRVLSPYQISTASETEHEDIE